MKKTNIKNFILRNKFPEVIEETWAETPKENQRVEVYYGGTIYSTNNNVWWVNGNFVNKYGFPIKNVLGWKPYNKVEN